jgi:hypothetical protein
LGAPGNENSPIYFSKWRPRQTDKAFILRPLIPNHEFVFLHLPAEAEQAEKPAAMCADSKAAGGRFTIEWATAGEVFKIWEDVNLSDTLPGLKKRFRIDSAVGVML